MLYVKCRFCGNVTRLEDYDQSTDDKIELLFKIVEELHYRQSILERLLK